MVQTERVEIFNELVGHLFAEMHQTFPFEAHFDPGDLARKMKAEPGRFMGLDDPNWADATFSTGESVQKFLKATLVWLEREGFILRPSGAGFSGILTAKAFAALNTTPVGLIGDRTLGKSLAAVATEGTKEFSRAAVAQLAQTTIATATTMLLRGQAF